MGLILRRTHFTNLSTVGELSMTGNPAEKLCDTLEDTCRRDLNKNGVLDREDKLYGETAIPAGRYAILFEWSPKYKRRMPFIYGKKVGRSSGANLFNDVMFHWGNRPADSHGCILVGQYDPTIPNLISNSRFTFDTVYDRFIRAEKPLHLDILGGLKAEALAA